MLFSYYCITLIWAVTASGLPLLEELDAEKLKAFVLQHPEGAIGIALLAGSIFGGGSVVFWQGVAKALHPRREEPGTSAQCSQDDDIWSPKSPDPQLEADDVNFWGGEKFADILRGSAKRENLSPQQAALLRSFDEGLSHATQFLDDYMLKAHKRGYFHGRQHGYWETGSGQRNPIVRYRDGLYAGSAYKDRPLRERDAHVDGYGAGWDFGSWLHGQQWSRYVASQDAYENGWAVGSCARKIYQQWGQCNHGRATIQQIHDWTLHCIKVEKQRKLDEIASGRSPRRPSSDQSHFESSTRSFGDRVRDFTTSTVDDLKDAVKHIPGQMGQYRPRLRARPR